MLFQRKSATSEVAAGAVFERTRASCLTEVATVTWVGTDPIGIPHVRFLISAPGDRERGDSRILSLAVFTEQYAPSAVAAAH
ncbi:MAG: hypothetical protein QF893_21425 [Alphaproteobacteria bacterium]|jgi:hypothetical protein|nr:hypothetical protein [Alphaproteobacteria bacterium]